MRSILILAAVCGLSATPVAAQTVSWELGIHSRYVDNEAFNDSFSDKPMVKLDLLIESDDGVYLDGYVYSGSKDPMNDAGSEYGLEAGKTWSLNDVATVTVAGGRYANYAGGGFSAGDWYAYADVAWRGLTISVSGLSGDTDSALLGLDYRLPLDGRLSIDVGVKYLTAYKALNPAITASCQLSERFAIQATAVAPDREDGRKVFASLGLVWSF